MSESTELQRSIENLTRVVEKLEERLVRKDVYESDQKGVVERFANIDDKIRGVQAGVTGVAATVEKIEERRAADRRLVITSFALPLLLIVLQLYLAAQTGGAS